jgi:hypothetical protein
MSSCEAGWWRKSPLGRGSCEKIGRASLLASYRPSKSLPHEARREPRPPGVGRFEFFSHLPLDNGDSRGGRKSFQAGYLELLEKFNVPYDERYIFKPIE